MMMRYEIRYAARCTTGLVRRNNQDNLLLDSFHLPEVNRAMEEGKTGKTDSKNGCLLAVFDGIGGAPHGEAAAYIAARTMSSGLKRPFWNCVRKEEDTVRESLLNVNREAIRYRNARKIRDYGCTVAGIWIDRGKISAFNLGDSRIYCYQGGKLSLLSETHAIGRGILTQYIGMEEQEGPPDPAVRVMKMRHGLHFLICTDGVTACMTDREIAAHFEEKGSGDLFTSDIMETVRRRGAPDNATVIWCEVV